MKWLWEKVQRKLLDWSEVGHYWFYGAKEVRDLTLEKMTCKETPENYQLRMNDWRSHLNAVILIFKVTSRGFYKHARVFFCTKILPYKTIKKKRCHLQLAIFYTPLRLKINFPRFINKLLYDGTPCQPM